MGWEQAELVNMRAMLLQERLRLNASSAGITRNSAALAGVQVQRDMLLRQYQLRRRGRGGGMGGGGGGVDLPHAY